MTILELRNVSVSFGGVSALRDVNLAVKQAAIHGLIGPNGAGKTTLLNCIGRAARPTSGEIRFAGADILASAPHDISRLGIVRTFQNLALIEQATVIENVMIGLMAHAPSVGLSDFLPLPSRFSVATSAQRQARDALALLELTEYEDRIIGDLSYGIRKSVEIARALCAEPKLLMLDEPTAGLNPAEMERLGVVLRELRDARGLTILVITHHIEFLLGVADRVTVLDLGKVIAEGAPGLVRTDAAVIAAYLGGEA